MRPWHRAIAAALTGADLDLGVQDSPDVDALVAALSADGWPPERVREHAFTASGPWPHPVPDAVRAGLGMAQLHAAVRQARAAYGLESLDVRPPSRRTHLDADERRLLADKPPHHGG